MKLLSGTKTLLAKNISFVGALKNGASNANPEAKVWFTAIVLTDALGPRMERKSGWKIWKRGGVLFVGLKVCKNPFCRNVAFWPRTAKDRGGIVYIPCVMKRCLDKKRLTNVPQLQGVL